MLHNWMVGIKTVLNVNSAIIVKGIDMRLASLPEFREALLETLASTLSTKRDVLNITSILENKQSHHEVQTQQNGTYSLKHYTTCYVTSCCTVCQDSCTAFVHNGECDDGGDGSVYSNCPLGTDCSDCGQRVELLAGNNPLAAPKQTATHASFDRLGFNSLDSIEILYSVIEVGKDQATEMQDQIEMVASLPQAFSLVLRSNIATSAGAADSSEADALNVAKNDLRIILQVSGMC